LEIKKEKHFKARTRRHVSLPDSPDHHSQKSREKPRGKSIRTEGREDEVNKSIVSLRNGAKKKKVSVRTEESPQESERVDNDLKAVRKHL
jgi:hypothetical protein